MRRRHARRLEVAPGTSVAKGTASVEDKAALALNFSTLSSPTSLKIEKSISGWDIYSV